MNKLYLAYLGSSSKDRIMEDHEMLMVVADTPSEAVIKLKQKSKLKLDAIHIDILMEIDNIDGFDLNLVKSSNNENFKVFGYEEVKIFNKISLN